MLDGHGKTRTRLSVEYASISLLPVSATKTGGLKVLFDLTVSHCVYAAAPFNWTYTGKPLVAECRWTYGMQH